MKEAETPVHFFREWQGPKAANKLAKKRLKILVFLLKEWRLISQEGEFMSTIKIKTKVSTSVSYFAQFHTSAGAGEFLCSKSWVLSQYRLRSYMMNSTMLPVITPRTQCCAAIIHPPIAIPWLVENKEEQEQPNADQDPLAFFKGVSVDDNYQTDASPIPSAHHQHQNGWRWWVCYCRKMVSQWQG